MTGGRWPHAWLYLAFRDCVTLDLAIRHQSLSGAARMLGESKATISRRLANLEGRLGTALLLRSHRGISPTTEGTALASECRLLADRFSLALSKAGEEWTSRSGVVRLGIVGGVRADWLTKLLLAFSHEVPEVEVEVVRLAADRGLDDSVSLTLTTGPLPDGPFRCSKVDEYDQGLFVTESYLRTRDRPSKPMDLLGHPLVVPCTRANKSVTITYEDQTIEVYPSFRPCEIAFAEALVASGAGIGLLPLRATTAATAANGLIQLQGDWSVPATSVYLVSADGDVEPMRTRLLRKFIKSHGLRRPECPRAD